MSKLWDKIKGHFRKAVRLFFRITDSVFSFLLPFCSKRFQKWFRRWKPIHLCKWFIKHGLSVPRFLVGLDWSDVSEATYDSKSVEISEDDDSVGVFFKPDGTKMYVFGQDHDKVYQYSLSTAWDVSTASYDSKYKEISEDSFPYGPFFKPDGTKMYMNGSANERVYQYTLSTAWDVSTATYDSKYGSIRDDTCSIFFKPDGTKLYVAEIDSDRIYQYSLSTAWDISTLSSDGKYKDVTSEDTFPSGVFFKPDGTKMYIIGTNDTVFQYTLSTAWDVSTATYDSVYKSMATEDTRMRALFFKSDGTKIYTVGDLNEEIFQYSLPVVVVDPTVTTSSVISIDKTTATGRGNITDDGGGTATRGMCWSKSSTPTTSSYHATNGSGEGSYSVPMTSLDPDTKYYVRAYSINSAGTSYGSEVNFTTDPDVEAPTVTTQAVSSIDKTTATGNGNITDDGGATATRGMCWDTSATPTVADSHATNGTGEGAYTVAMTSLLPNTKYYVRAYATNSEGTSYGSEVEFDTLSAATGNFFRMF